MPSKKAGKDAGTKSPAKGQSQTVVEEAPPVAEIILSEQESSKELGASPSKTRSDVLPASPDTKAATKKGSSKPPSSPVDVLPASPDTKAATKKGSSKPPSSPVGPSTLPSSSVDAKTKEPERLLPQSPSPTIVQSPSRTPSRKSDIGAADYQQQIISLSSIPDHWLLASPLLSEAKGSDTKHALHATLTFLKNLYYLDNDEWKQVRDKVQVGLVKDTDFYGDMSVSMGTCLAVRPFASSVGFVNCGTGGIRYLLYSKSDGCLYQAQENKPKGGANLNKLRIGKYSPKDAVSFDTLKQTLLKELSKAPWKDKPDVPVYAFVTGPIRQHWEGADADEKKILESELARLFEGTNVKAVGDMSYFLTLEEEARLELLGTCEMYKNLERKQLLKKDTVVVASLSVGQSCQWVAKKMDARCDLISFNAGMNTPKELVGLSRAIVGVYEGDADKLDEFVKTVRKASHPVIALKAGCVSLLLGEAKEAKDLKLQLLTPVSTVNENVTLSLKIAACQSQSQLTSFKWKRTSLDRLCAVASVELKDPTDFCHVYRAGSLITSAAEIQEGDVLVFAALGDKPQIVPESSDKLASSGNAQAQKTEDYQLIEKDSSLSPQGEPGYHMVTPPDVDAEVSKAELVVSSNEEDKSPEKKVEPNSSTEEEGEIGGKTKSVQGESGDVSPQVSTEKETQTPEPTLEAPQPDEATPVTTSTSTATETPPTPTAEVPTPTEPQEASTQAPEQVLEQASGKESVPQESKQTISKEELAVKSTDKSDFQSDIIPLSSIPDKWLLVSETIQQALYTQDDEGPLHALDAALTLLQKLYYLDSSNGCVDEGKWKSIRDKIAIGLVKDTKEYGNTSVSMGAAAVDKSKSKIGLVNCGTGGNKYQLYSRENGCLRLVSEYKPKGGANFNNLSMAGYIPSEKEEILSFDKLKELFTQELAHKDLPWKDMPNLTVCLFITGKIRQSWEEADQQAKDLMENEIADFLVEFPVCPLKGAGFFMSQEDEGRFELIGTQTMYDNLAQHGLLEKGTHVIASLGIGRGSCQWMVDTGDAPDLIPHRAGMNNVRELGALGQTVANVYQTQADRLAQLLKALESCPHPVIALKSGCAILLEKSPALKQQLKTLTISSPEVPLRVTNKKQRAPVELQLHCGSLDRLCAEVSAHFQGSAVYRVVLHKGERVIDPKNIHSRDLLQFEEVTYPILNFKKGGKAIEFKAKSSRIPDTKKLVDDEAKIVDSEAKNVDGEAKNVDGEAKYEKLAQSPAHPTNADVSSSIDSASTPTSSALGNSPQVSMLDVAKQNDETPHASPSQNQSSDSLDQSQNAKAALKSHESPKSLPQPGSSIGLSQTSPTPLPSTQKKGKKQQKNTPNKQSARTDAAAPESKTETNNPKDSDNSQTPTVDKSSDIQVPETKVLETSSIQEPTEQEFVRVQPARRRSFADVLKANQTDQVTTDSVTPVTNTTPEKTTDSVTPVTTTTPEKTSSTGTKLSYASMIKKVEGIVEVAQTQANVHPNTEAHSEVIEEKPTGVNEPLEAQAQEVPQTPVQPQEVPQPPVRAQEAPSAAASGAEVKEEMTSLADPDKNEAKMQVPFPLQKDIVPLSSIPDHWLLAAPWLRASRIPDDMGEGPVHALHAVLSLLKNLYFMKDPKWVGIRDQVTIGLVKDTKEYGNTSVSMGAAVESNFTSRVGFLNCGTGGIKYQMYERDEQGGYVRLVKEFKPKDGSNPNSLAIGEFVPKRAVSFEETKNLLQKELADSALPWANETSIPIYAFITGTIRQHWEEANEQQQKLMEAEMTKLFEDTPVKFLCSSFFMTQEEEGKLEFVGTQAMYANLEQHGQLEKGTRVVASFGIGRGSCQWMVRTSDGRDELIPHQAGMARVSELAEVGKTVIDKYQKHPDQLARLVEMLEKCSHPVIALKSGCTLLLENKAYPKFKENLTTPIPRGNKSIMLSIATIKNPRSRKDFLWARSPSLDRLCAEASVILTDSIADFTAIYHNDALLTSTEDLKEGDFLVFGTLSDIPIPPCTPSTSPLSSPVSATTADTSSPTIESALAAISLSVAEDKNVSQVLAPSLTENINESLSDVSPTKSVTATSPRTTAAPFAVTDFPPLAAAIKPTDSQTVNEQERAVNAAKVKEKVNPASPLRVASPGFEEAAKNSAKSTSVNVATTPSVTAATGAKLSSAIDASAKFPLDPRAKSTPAQKPDGKKSATKPPIEATSTPKLQPNTPHAEPNSKKTTPIVPKKTSPPIRQTSATKQTPPPSIVEPKKLITPRSTKLASPPVTPTSTTVPIFPAMLIPNSSSPPTPIIATTSYFSPSPLLSTKSVTNSLVSPLASKPTIGPPLPPHIITSTQSSTSTAGSSSSNISGSGSGGSNSGLMSDSNDGSFGNKNSTSRALPLEQKASPGKLAELFTDVLGRYYAKPCSAKLQQALAVPLPDSSDDEADVIGKQGGKTAMSLTSQMQNLRVQTSVATTTSTVSQQANKPGKGEFVMPDPRPRRTSTTISATTAPAASSFITTYFRPATTTTNTTTTSTTTSNAEYPYDQRPSPLLTNLSPERPSVTRTATGESIARQKSVPSTPTTTTTTTSTSPAPPERVSTPVSSRSHSAMSSSTLPSSPAKNSGSPTPRPVFKAVRKLTGSNPPTPSSSSQPLLPTPTATQLAASQHSLPSSSTLQSSSHPQHGSSQPPPYQHPTSQLQPPQYSSPSQQRSSTDTRRITSPQVHATSVSDDESGPDIDAQKAATVTSKNTGPTTASSTTSPANITSSPSATTTSRGLIVQKKSPTNTNTSATTIPSMPPKPSSASLPAVTPASKANSTTTTSNKPSARTPFSVLDCRTPAGSNRLEVPPEAVSTPLPIDDDDLFDLDPLSSTPSPLAPQRAKAELDRTIETISRVYQQWQAINQKCIAAGTEFVNNEIKFREQEKPLKHPISSEQRQAVAALVAKKEQIQKGLRSHITAWKPLLAEIRELRKRWGDLHDEAYNGGGQAALDASIPGYFSSIAKTETLVEEALALFAQDYAIKSTSYLWVFDKCDCLTPTQLETNKSVWAFDTSLSRDKIDAIMRALRPPEIMD